jgi:cell wall-associated NlpC family hydrolase
VRFPARLIAAAVCAVLAVPAGVLGAVGTSYATAPATGPTPTPQQIAAAKAKAAKTAAKLDKTTQQLKAVQAQLTTESTAAELAITRWQSAQAAATKAQAALTAAQAVAATADASAQGYRQQLNSYAVSAYMDGGPIASLGAMLNATDPADVLTRNATLQAIGRGQTRIVSDFTTASAGAATARATAQRASESARHLLDDASSARATAVGAVQLAQSLLATVDTAKRQLNDATGKARKNVSALVKQRAAALASARVAAARLAGQRLQRLATIGGFPAATPEQGVMALKWATSQLGVPYSWGGGDASGPTFGFAEDNGVTDGLHTIGFDCSGLTLFAWAHVGYALGHWTGAQWVEGAAVSREDLRAGDLLFFATDVTDPTTIHHVGIYAGNGQMIDAPETGAVVRYDPAFNDSYVGAIRP